MKLNLYNSIRKLYDYFQKYSIALNNKLDKIKIFNHHIFKYKSVKVIIAILIFILIFDKLTIFLIMTAIYGFQNSHKNKTSENYNNLSSKSGVENYYDNISELSKVFKHPELDLNSYNDVVIDPEKVFLQGNKFLPECCFYNSEYSTSKGCACITPEQENYLLARGKNKSYLSFIQQDDEYKNIYFSPTSTIKQNESQFITHNTDYIAGYTPLGVDKINEFYGLINLRP